VRVRAMCDAMWDARCVTGANARTRAVTDA